MSASQEATESHSMLLGGSGEVPTLQAAAFKADTCRPGGFLAAERDRPAYWPWSRCSCAARVALALGRLPCRHGGPEAGQARAEVGQVCHSVTLLQPGLRTVGMPATEAHSVSSAAASDAH